MCFLCKQNYFQTLIIESGKSISIHKCQVNLTEILRNNLIPMKYFLLIL